MIRERIEKMMSGDAKNPVANSLRYLLADGRGFGLGAGFRLSVEKSLKTPQNPTSPVRALFGGFRTIEFGLSRYE